MQGSCSVRENILTDNTIEGAKYLTARQDQALIGGPYMTSRESETKSFNTLAVVAKHLNSSAIVYSQ
jgi:hypothetical protein